MWFLQRLRSGVKMESFEAKSQLDNQQQLPDSQLQSDSSVDDDKLVQVLTQDLENLVLSSKDEVNDRYIQGHSVVTDEEDQVKQAIDEPVNDTCQAIEVDPNEFRVLEERETGESEVGCENQDDDVIDYEHKDRDLKEKVEVGVEDEDVSSEIGDENDKESEYVENLEIERDDVGGDGWEEGSVAVPDGGKLKAYHYPLRLHAGDCSLYIRTGMCKFGSNCRFNHPIRRKNQPTKEKKKQKEEKVERHGQKECKYHTSSAGCKLGKACKFSHGRGKTVKTPVVEYNFVGLPIRPGEKECPYYMRNGSCKYGPSCWFNHPDPTAVGDGDAPTYGEDGPLPSQPAPQPNIPSIPSWSAPRTPDPTSAFVPMMHPPTQNMPPPNPDWNGYQAPAPVPAHLYPNSERALPIPPAFFPNNPPSDTNMYTHHQQPMLVSEYPERPGQPDCGHFMKTGDCKYRASCKFHHPQSRVARTLRDQRICSYFRRHGTCKYGPACKYDHPVNHNGNSNPAGKGGQMGL
ncbi:hypothetical protein L1987_51817 [Smallanthus sonchifolius]|uniref:Uncharacterized protein n=1 Tax=Smallanthus sonchifolius TaxID=185202 RepID=A0ACB9ERE8_9ASTR|nr:hypothetical protein L1987_51817 [Smallanthus sonchifolius]